MAYFNCLAALLLFPVLFVGCDGDGSATLPEDDPGTNIVEIREYMGEKLSGTSSMRENSIRGPQEIDIDTWRLKVEGLVDHPREFTYQELLERERVKRVVWLHCVDGWSAKILWEGFSLSKLFDEAGARNEATYALFYAHDGYHNFLTTSFIRSNDILAATHANGKPLRGDRGFPLHIVSQSKYGYKWCKWVTRIVLAGNTQGAGFYENSGYPAEGNVGDWFYDPDESRLTP